MIKRDRYIEHKTVVPFIVRFFDPFCFVVDKRC